MGLYSNDAPPAPDYAAANEAGVKASAAVLPFQLALDRAARMGTTYTDPDTGKVYDFTGMGDAAINDLNSAQTERLMRSGADIQRDLTMGQYRDLLSLLPQYNELNLQSQRAAYDASLDAGRRGMANTYDLNLEYMPRFGELQRDENLRSFLQNLDLGEQGTRRFADLQNELLPATNAAGLDAQGAAYRRGLEDLRTSDPARYALQQKLLAAAQTDLDAGSSLTAEQLDQLQQKIRGSQASRGNILGAGAGYDEARMSAEMGQNLQQQRRQSALAILNGSSVEPKYTAASAVNPLMPNYNPTTTLNPQTPSFQATTTGGPNLNPVPINNQTYGYVNPNAGAAGVDYANQQYSQQMNFAANQTNPWMAGLSLAFQGLGAAGAAGLVCWVAREVFGPENMRWLEFRHWLLTAAPEPLRRRYIAKGERFARLIHNRPNLRTAVRDWMNAILDRRTTA